MRKNSRAQRKTQNIRKKIAVVTDGTLTERGYFEAVNKLSSDTIHAHPKKGKDIDELVEEAIRLKDPSFEYDIVAIVCDIDQRLHTEKTRKKLLEAIRKAKENNILVCLSHESFEIWLLAHVCKVSSIAAYRKNAQKLVLKNGLVYKDNDKQIVEKLITTNNIKNAIAEAQRLRKVYGDDILTNSPLTNVDLLIEKISL